MGKFALLVGVSKYHQLSLQPLPSAEEDVRAVRRILQDPEIGGFLETDITTLVNPERQPVEEAIYQLFANRHKDDLVLFYFSGHGISDRRNGELYFATNNTRQDDNNDLITPTAVAAKTLHNDMERSRSKYQIVILDCCFSGAFAKGMSAKDDGKLNIQAQLAGRGRAVLTSSSSTQYSFHQEGFTLSTYTHYLVQGIETGSADYDGDGWIDADELHEYVSKRIKETAPLMTPKFFPVEEGYKIRLAKSKVFSVSDKQVLFLASNFKKPDRKHLSTELQEIQHYLKVSNRKGLEFKRPNSDFLEDFQASLYSLKPNFIHFSGYENSEEGLLIVSSTEQTVQQSTDVWMSLLKSSSRYVKCVILNICPLKEQANNIAKYIDFVIGIGPNIEAWRSIQFTRSIYAALASNLSIEDAFLKACNETKQSEEDLATPIAFLVRKSDILGELVKSNLKRLESEAENTSLIDETCYYLVELCRYEEAISLYDQSLSFKPNNPVILRHKAAALEKLSRYEEALVCCERALKVEPEGVSYLRQKGSILRHLGKLEEALLVFNKVLESEPQNYVAWSERGTVLEGLEKFEDALQSYEKSLSFSPENEITKNKIISLHCKRKKSNQESHSVTKIQSENYEDWITQGYISEWLEQYDDAILAYNTALKLEPNNINILIQLAKVLQKLKRSEEAISQYNLVLSLQPSHYVARTQKGLILRSLKKNKEAIAEFNQSLRKSKFNYRAAKYEQRWTYRNKGT